MNCYDAAASALPAQFTFGTASRNILRGPKFMSTDLSLMKTVPIGGGVRFQFRMEFYNIFNNVNYGNPGSTFGVPLSASFGRITSAGTMRQVQLGGKNLFLAAPPALTPETVDYATTHQSDRVHRC